MIITLNPLVGAGFIKFGMHIDDLLTELRQVTNKVDVRKRSTNHVYAFGSSLQIEMDDRDSVQYIGVGFYPGCGAEYRLYDVNPFATSAGDLFGIISKYSSGEHRYNPAEYLWEDVVTTVWEADAQYDYLGGESQEVYGSVGIGNSVYLNAIKNRFG